MSPAEESPRDISFSHRLARARRAVQAAFSRPGGLIQFSKKRLDEVQITRAAAALSFSTALAVVPALDLILATVAAFPVFDSFRLALQMAIVTNLVPDTGMKINEALGNFVQAAGQLTPVGVIGIVITAVFLLLTIESALDEIFRVIHPRRLSHRLLVFLAVLTIGPVLLGCGLSLLGYFASQEMIEGKAAPIPAVILLGNLAPTLLTWMTLTFLFVIFPNRRTRLKDAMTGAAVAALLLTVLRYTFALYIVLTTSYQAIYGALAAVPVFLVWIFLVWLAVLMGAVVTATLPDWRYARAEVGEGTAGRLLLALEVLARLAAVGRGGVGLTLEYLAQNLAAPDIVLTAILDDLRTGQFITATNEHRWVLSRDLERTPLADLVHHFGLGLNFHIGTDDMKETDMAKRVGQYLRSAEDSERAQLSVSLARIVMPQPASVTSVP